MSTRYPVLPEASFNCEKSGRETFLPDAGQRSRAKRIEALSGTGTVMEATKARLEAVAYLPVPMVRIHFPPPESPVRT